MEVHKELGNGFLEAVYQEALEREFLENGIPYIREIPLTIYYKNKPLKKNYIADFVCYNKIIVELKALSAIVSEHKAQVINYLKITHFDLGIIINFGTMRLTHERIIRDHSRYESANATNKNEWRVNE